MYVWRKVSFLWIYCTIIDWSGSACVFGLDFWSRKAGILDVQRVRIHKYHLYTDSECRLDGVLNAC